MTFIAAAVEHADFYVTVATVYAFLFVTLNIQLLQPSPPSRRLKRGRDVAYTLIPFALATFGGLGIPILVLSGLVHGDHVTRNSALIAVFSEAAAATFLAGNEDA